MVHVYGEEKKKTIPVNDWIIRRAANAGSLLSVNRRPNKPGTNISIVYHMGEVFAVLLKVNCIQDGMTGTVGATDKVNVTNTVNVTGTIGGVTGAAGVTGIRLI